jgi:hypothetical protein
MLVKDIMTEDLITIESDKTALAAEKLLFINNKEQNKPIKTPKGIPVSKNVLKDEFIEYKN